MDVQYIYLISVVMEIDAIGTYNSTKAVYEHCFKVLFYCAVSFIELTVCMFVCVISGSWRRGN